MSMPSGRERLAQVQAADHRRRRRNLTLAVTAGVTSIVLVVVGVMWAISHDRQAKKAASAATIESVTHIPAATYDAVGAGGAQSDFTAMTKPSSTPQTKDGKPLVTYIGAEFCPYCAMDRWTLVTALSRFGTFAGLAPQTSSPDEGPRLSDLSTLTFRNATYSSPYLALTTYEMTDRLRNPLQKLPEDVDSFFAANKPSQGIPWVNWAGQVSSGVSYDGNVIVGKSGDEIGAALRDPNSTIARSILGSANLTSAYICTLTKNKPANVCESPGVAAAAKTLTVAKASS